jgi:hypothetical protein
MGPGLRRDDALKHHAQRVVRTSSEFHFWQVGHQNVERPFCVNRFTVPLHFGVLQGWPSRS